MGGKSRSVRQTGDKEVVDLVRNVLVAAGVNRRSSNSFEIHALVKSFLEN